MRNHFFWTGLVVAGLLIGATGTAGGMHAIGIRGPSAGVQLDGTEVLAAGLNTSDRAHGAGKARKAVQSTGDGRGIRTQPTPTPEPPPAPPKSFFDDHQVVSYYGHPLSGLLGALGQGTESQMLDRLKAEVAAYQAINSEKQVVPGLHLLYEVAQQFTSDDGLYLYRTDDATLQHYIQVTQQEGMLLFLDLQIGRSSLANELQYVLPYLRQPNVHLAIDPEFVTPPGLRPGLFIGTLDSLDINVAIQQIEALTERERLPNKIVIVHQFQDDMLTNKDQLDLSEPRVDVVLNMDGFGPQETKLNNYDSLVSRAGMKYGGIKLFYKQDTNLLSEQQIEDLDPRPVVIIYQ